MTDIEKQAALRRRRDTAEILSAYIDKISERQRRSSRHSSRSDNPCRRSLSNPVISESDVLVGRLERRRSAVTFPSTYRSLSSAPAYPCRLKLHTPSVCSVSHPELCNYNKTQGIHQQKSDWSLLGNYFRQPQDEKKLTLNQIRIRKSLEKAIQKAGYNMNEIVGASAGVGSPGCAGRESHVLTSVDWTENAIPDHHIWAPTGASGDLCYVGDDNCEKSGSRKRCSACHIVVHDHCFNQFAKIGFPCKSTFREFSSKNMRESIVGHHHWVHRRKLDGKCKQCGKSFEKRFGFREPTKIIAISCSWCKEAYHNKVHCFQLQKINEPCNLGVLSKSIVPSTWIIKSQKQKSLRNRSKRRSRSSSGTSRKRSTKETRTKTFVLRPLCQQAAFVCPTLVFINPKSGGRQGSKLLQAFHWLVNPRQVFDLSKEGPREALELYRKAPNLRILACGGDGTVGWILSVLDQLNMSRPPPVAILPLGTGNDLSRTLNFGHGYTDEPIQKIIQGVEEARIVKLDRWKITVEKNEDAGKTNDREEFHPPMEPEVQPCADQPPLDVINNYFSIGSDAQVILNFHESREAHPTKFTSRFGNKFFIARAGVNEYVSRQSKNLSKHITVECDGVDLTRKLRELKPVCIVFLNIPRYSSGTTPWGNPTGNEFRVQRHDDKLIEVLACSLNQLGMLFVGGHGERLAQCRSAVIRTTKPFPIQIDGEPCKLNPSIIKLEFFNQANMLTKTKRGNEIQPSHEQIKIRVNVVQNDNFDAFMGAKEPICINAAPLLVTVVMNQSTLDTLRSCLLLIMSEIERPSHPLSEKWIFLDACSSDKFYKIDKNQEGRLVVGDVITTDREVYILEVPEENHNITHLSASAADQQSSFYRNRIKSDSEVFKSKSSSAYEGISQTDGIEEECKFNGIDNLSDQSPDSASASLDVVFEQEEECSRSVSNEELPENLSLVTGNEQLIVPIVIEKQEHAALASPSLSHLRSTENHSESDCSSTYSTSSNEYILTDDSNMSSPTKKSPVRIAYSNPAYLDLTLPAVFSTQVSLDETKTRNFQTHKRSFTDSDAGIAAGFHLSPSQLLNTMKLNKNQSNNNGGHSASPNKNSNAVIVNNQKENRDKLPKESGVNDESKIITKPEDPSQWDKTFLNAAKRGDLEKMKQCISNGAQLSARDEEGCTALHQAVRFAYGLILSWLIENGDVYFLDILCRDRQQTALHKAAWYGRTNMCQKLLDAGASLNIKDYKGMRAIDKARQADTVGLVDMFVKYEASKKAEHQETDL